MAHLNKYALIAQEHLKKHRPEMFRDLRANGGLNLYLSDLGEQISQTVDEVRLRTLQKNPPPKDFLGKHRHLAWAQQSAEEIALNDLLYNSLPSETSTAESEAPITA